MFKKENSAIYASDGTVLPLFLEGVLYFLDEVTEYLVPVSLRRLTLTTSDRTPYANGLKISHFWATFFLNSVKLSFRILPLGTSAHLP